MLERKIRAVLSTESEFDVLFVHRDADSAGTEERSREIAEAARNAELVADRVNVIPVRTTEAWILLNEAAIRRVAGNPRGRQPLNLPRPSRVEDATDPKAVLESALVAASGCQGHRLRKFRKKFRQHRRILLEQLPVGGALDEVPAWVRLRQSVADSGFPAGLGMRLRFAVLNSLATRRHMLHPGCSGIEEHGGRQLHHLLMPVPNDRSDR